MDNVKDQVAMVMVSKSCKMAVSMKATGPMTQLMVKVNSILLTAIITKVTGPMIKQMDMDYMCMPMVIVIEASG